MLLSVVGGADAVDCVTSVDQYVSILREGEIFSNGCSLDTCIVSANTNTRKVRP